MAAYKSTQETKRTASPPKMLAAHELKGRVRVAWFDYTVPTGGVAVDDTIDLTTLPQGARILGGEMAFEAMSSDAGTAQIQVGDGTTAAKYLGTTSVEAAGTSLFANTIALAYGQVIEEETTLVATVKGEAWTAGKKLYGWCRYALD